MKNPKRNSILCPNCRKLISADESRCPHCGIAKPGSRWKNNIWTRGFRDTDQFIRAIIYVNIGMFVISLLLYPRGASLSLNPFLLLSPSSRSLVLLGATGTIPIDNMNRWWTLLSANYLHGGILHILFNMIAFRQLAPLVIQEFGTYRMFVIYTLGAIIGFWVSYLAGVTLTIGASAAVCSLIGASLFFGKSRGGIYGQAIYKQIGAWAVGIFLFGFLVPGINNWAHAGGIFAGIGVAFLLGYNEKKQEGLFHKMLAGGCAVLTAAILMWAVILGIYIRILG
jgi:rhomboid protease GluP